jgi:hypothetical protein
VTFSNCEIATRYWLRELSSSAKKLKIKSARLVLLLNVELLPGAVGLAVVGIGDVVVVVAANAVVVARAVVVVAGRVVVGARVVVAARVVVVLGRTVVVVAPATCSAQPINTAKTTSAVERSTDVAARCARLMGSRPRVPL